MKTFKIVLLAALVGASGIASAAYNGSREDRMQAALDDYHRTSGANGAGGKNARSADSTRTRYSDPRNPSPGPAARAETSVKRGASSAGSTIKRVATKTGHAIATGARKTGHAVAETGRKVTGKTGE